MVAVVEFSQVSIRRGNSYLLSQIDLKVNEGERWVIVGPNGSGKSTLLSVMSAQTHPSEGTASLLGETLGRVDVFELRPRIGVTSALLSARIPRAEKVRDVVVSAAYGVLGRWRENYDSFDYDRADDLMAALNVHRLADRTFGTLSEGEKKRVEICRALMTDPELLVLDEPGVGLDLSGREMLVETLSYLAADPMSPTIVLVTHHLEEIPEHMTHALLLNHGRIVASGAINDVLTDANMSLAYEMPLRLTNEDGRWSGRADRRNRRNAA